MAAPAVSLVVLLAVARGAWSARQLPHHLRVRGGAVGFGASAAEAPTPLPTPAPPPPPRPLKAGVLVVGLGGNNGATLAAALEAARRDLAWETSHGKVSASESATLGCISQLPKGPCGAWLEALAVPHMRDMVLGGWDIRPTALGDSLYDSRVLPHDLVRQVRSPLNRIRILPGVYDPSFIGESQHASATHVLQPPVVRSSDSSASSPMTVDARRFLLRRIRRDIRSFKQRHGLTGPGAHVTVIWSASVERPSSTTPETAEELLALVEGRLPGVPNDREVAPSLVYATAAALEGCSFVNGGSQNTLCRGLVELCAQHRCYALGTDFKAGQTKFKTAAVEYARALGLSPRVIASSNHLGNNDMRNLQSPATVKAKLRVKQDIFGAWNETQLDHQVRVMYTPFIGDEKRDVVEYTALGLLGEPWTMLTYTRAMDSILCVPLMVDVAAWCAAFAAKGLSAEAAARATSYLFKVPEGPGDLADQDPGFFAQMQCLRETLTALVDMPSPAPVSPAPRSAPPPPPPPRGAPSARYAEPPEYLDMPSRLPFLRRKREAVVAEQDTSKVMTEWGEEECIEGGVICAGLACLDMQLVGASRTQDHQSINDFQSVRTCAGGSAPQSAGALARLGVKTCAVCRVGQDAHADELRRLLTLDGAPPEADEFIVDTTPPERGGLGTSLAVLPVFQDGTRGCFVELAANIKLSPRELLTGIQEAVASASSYPLNQPLRSGGNRTFAGASLPYRCLHFGYPHLLPGCSGRRLGKFLRSARKILEAGVASDSSEAGDDTAPKAPRSLAALERRIIVSLDLNGVTSANEDGRGRVVPPDALRQVDVLHASEGEAALIAGLKLDGNYDEEFCRRVASWAHKQGVAVLCLTLGAGGCFVSTTPDSSRLASLRPDWHAGAAVRLSAFRVGTKATGSRPGADTNSNGAGDTFCAGFLAALLWRKPFLTLEEAAKAASLAALWRVDTALRASPNHISMNEIVLRVASGETDKYPKCNADFNEEG